MNNPLISVIVPIYNVEPYLCQCVDSVLSQTYKNLDIILVDDGSSDRSPAICDEYAKKDDRIRVIHKSNGGLSDARNVGFDSCKGESVFYLDADDYLESQCLEMLVIAAENGALVMTGYILDFSNEGKLVKADQAYGIYATMKDYLLAFYTLFATKFNFVWGKLYSTEIIRKNNLRFQKGLSLVEDVIFNLDYYRYCDKEIIAVSHNGYYYRQHGGYTLSKKFNPQMFVWNEYSYTTIYDYLVEFGCLTEDNRIHLYRNVLGNYHYNFYLVALNCNIPMSEKVKLIRKYLLTPIYQDSLSVIRKERHDYRIFNWLLRHGMIRAYIRLEQLKNRICHGNN